MAMKTKDQAALLQDFDNAIEEIRRALLWSGFSKKRELQFHDAVEHLEVRFHKLYDAHCKDVNASTSSSADGEGA